MSNLFSTVANYSGRQPDNVQNIKQFVTNIANQVVWVYKRQSSGVTVITPGDKTKNVLKLCLQKTTKTNHLKP